MAYHADTDQHYDEDEQFICDDCVNVTDVRDGDGTLCNDCLDDEDFVCYECGEVCFADDGNGETCDDCAEAA